MIKTEHARPTDGRGREDRQNNAAFVASADAEVGHRGLHVLNARDAIERLARPHRQAQCGNQFLGNHRLIGAGVDDEGERPFPVNHDRNGHPPIKVRDRFQVAGRCVDGMIRRKARGDTGPNHSRS